MDGKVRVLISTSTDPWFNLATEEWIYRELDPSRQTLFLWRNHDTVVIGRSQNPWSECNLERMEADGVRLARRTTGGGAVFHDMGNTCFTFLSPKSGYDRAANLGIVVRTLAKFGVTAEISGRNDLVIAAGDGSRKISGSAFREARDRSFHHGTLLISADLNRLANYLTPNPKKIASKGRASVRARVANIREFAPQISHEILSQALIEEFARHYGSVVEVEELDPERLQGIEALSEKFREFASWEWRFGHAPNFQHQMSEYFPWGAVEVHTDVEHGRIVRAQVFSDALDPDMIDDFAAALLTQTYKESGIGVAKALCLAKHPERVVELQQLCDWVASEIETK